MAQITLSVGGTSYVVGCQDGDEAHVRALAQEVERRLKRVSNDLSPSGDAHALFLTALFLVDELHDLRVGQVTNDGREILARAEAIIEERRREKERVVQAADLAERLAQQLGSGGSDTSIADRSKGKISER